MLETPQNTSLDSILHNPDDGSVPDIDPGRRIECNARKTFFMLGAWLLVAVLGGCTSLIPTEPGETLAHFNEEAPQPGDVAPEFELRDLTGKTFSLQNLIGEKPLVIRLGSHTCPVYRYRRHGMRKLQNEFAGRVEFLVIYTLEAHPTGSDSPYSDQEWRPFINRITGINVPQAADLPQRLAQANKSVRSLDIGATVVVDTMTNETWQAFGSAPSPAFVLDTRGRIVLTQAWTEPDEIRVTLQTMLDTEKRAH